MKETNMEHFRGEIETIMAENKDYIPAVVNGKPKPCRLIKNCYGCEFESNEMSCTIPFVKWLMSEYKPEPVLTAREKHFVEFVQTGYIARDKSGGMWWHERKPVKNNGEWQCFAYTMAMNSKAYKYGKDFSFITWEDEEPWSVADLRKLKALEYNPEDVAFPKGGSDENSNV